MRGFLVRATVAQGGHPSFAERLTSGPATDRDRVAGTAQQRPLAQPNRGLRLRALKRVRCDLRARRVS